MCRFFFNKSLSIKYQLTSVLFIFSCSTLFAQQNGEVILFGNEYDFPTKTVELYRDGKKNGISIKYYYTGYDNKIEKILDSGSYVNGKKEGIWLETILKSDDLRSSYFFEFGEYHNDKKEGIWNIYHRDSRSIYASGNYIEGKKNGKWIFNINGREPKTGFYIDDKKNGEWVKHEKNLSITSIYKNDTLMKEISVIDSTNKPYREYIYENGKSVTRKYWEKSGLLMYEIIILPQSNKQVCRNYYENGKLESVENSKFDDKSYNWLNGQFYLVGKNHGLVAEYYPNGKPKFEKIYVNGEENGLSKFYHENGLIDEIGNYKNGLMHGTWKEFYENGKLMSEGAHFEGSSYGNKVGFWKFFYDNGKLQEAGNYISDKKSGLWKYYWRNGRLRKVGYHNHKNGLKSGFKYFTPEGNAISYEEFRSRYVKEEILY